MKQTYMDRVRALLPASHRSPQINYASHALELFYPNILNLDVTTKSRAKITPPNELVRRWQLISSDFSQGVKVQCDCSYFEQTWALMDVSALPVELTDGADFACHGCISSWYREKKTVNGEILTPLLLQQLFDAT